ncbi:unnamed protein product [Discula destructiva]
MAEYFQLVPSITLGKATLSADADSHDEPRNLKKRPCSTSSPPYNPLSRLVRGANDFLTPRKDAKAESDDREEARKLQRKQILGLRMKNATSLAQWTSAAEELDLLEGNQAWKAELGGVSGFYRPDYIRDRMRDLDEARTNCDIRRMVHLVRTALSRELGGMGNIDLYKHSYIGTKDLIEQYVSSAVQTIEALVEKSGYPGALPDGLDHDDILEAFIQARQSFGRSALLLSGGGTFGMLHTGVLKAMFEADLLPRIMSGASAGSIVCAVFCTRTQDEVPAVIKEFPYGDLAVFEEYGQEESIMDHVKRLFTEGSWSDIKHLTRVMRTMLGDMTFQEAYNRTRKICNISVSTQSIYELPRLLNYITAPNVMIWSAVAASCSVPLVFSAAPLLVKDPQTGEHMPWNPTPQKWVDGSVDNDLPMTRLAEMFNVNHFIVSQVNPHVVPFLEKDDRLYPDLDGSRSEVTGGSDSTNFTSTLTALAKDEAMHRLQFLAELGIFPTTVTKLLSILSQKYSGDITILPEFNANDLPRILKNPTIEFMERATLSGERATWPTLSRIRDRCAVELAIDRSIQTLRTRCLFSQSQVDLRRLATDTKGLSLNISFAHGLYRSGADDSPQACPQSAADQTKSRRRSRRNSAASLHMLSKLRGSSGDGEDAITDDDTEREEFLELSLRRSSTSASTPGRATTANKPRMKRGALKAMQGVSLSRLGPMTNPFPAYVGGEENSEFDFSKPLDPPPASNEQSTQNSHLPTQQSRALFRSPIVFSRSSPQLYPTPPYKLEVMSPTTGDLDTSDLPFSDEDNDMPTDDSTSDPDPYSQRSLGETETTPQKDSEDEQMCGDECGTAGGESSRADSPSAAALADDERELTDPGDGMWD